MAGLLLLALIVAPIAIHVIWWSGQKWQISEDSLGYFYVRNALGPWPMRNFAWTPLGCFTSRSAAEEWIADGSADRNLEDLRKYR